MTTKYLAVYFLAILGACGETMVPEVIEDTHCPGGLSPIGREVHRVDRLQARWGKRVGPGEFIPGTIVTFSFVEFSEEGEEGVVVEPIVDSTELFPDNARALIREAFVAWSHVADIDFREAVEPGDRGVIRIGAHRFDSNTRGGHGFFPPRPGLMRSELSGDIHLNVEDDWRSVPGKLKSVVMHEIGHAMGLRHIVRSGTNEAVVMQGVFNPLVPRQQLTVFDRAYLQRVYGAPVPKFEKVTTNQRQLRWTFDSSIPVYDLHAIVCPAEECNIEPTPGQPGDIAIASITEHPAVALELQCAEVSLQSLADSAEEPRNSILDDRVGDGTFFEDLGNEIEVAAWSLQGDRDPETDRAYRIGADSIGRVIEGEFFTPARFFDLPLLSSLYPVEATSTTQWKFKRSFSLSAGQNIAYRILNDSGAVIPSLGFVEVGTNSPLGVNTGYLDAPMASVPSHVSFRDGMLVFDLSSLAGSFFSVEYTLLFTDDFFLEGEAYVDDIALEDVLVNDRKFVVITNSIGPQDSQYTVEAVPAGHYDFRIRVRYEGNAKAEETHSSSPVRRLF